MHTPAPSFARRLSASLITGFVTALVVHAAVVLMYFVSNGASGEALVALNNYFLAASLSLAVLLTIAALLGAFRTWWGAAIAGLVGGIAASALGVLYAVVSSGTAWSDQATAFLFTSLAGTSLVFEVGAVVAALTAGRALWKAALSWSRDVPRRIALVRPPSSRLAEGEITHLERVPVDAELAETQWDGYVAALAAEGFEVLDVAAADDHPDSVFIEDTVVIFGDLAVITSPGAESRRGEITDVRETVASLGLRVAEIAEPGTLDGGDVLKVGTTVYVGRGGRTNGEGIRQLRAILSPLGYTVVAVPVKKALHLKSVVTALPDGTVIGYPKLVEHPGVFGRFLAVPEEHGSAVVVLSDDAVLLSSSAPKTATLLADLGYRVVTVDVSEFEKLEGCVTCLSVRIR
ncbi:dimethylargininase [Leifsonia sp. AK011]|uniref:dimethylargininase n=1 Tax=Leifsonia sp. AK011 TaxID=2723075 RepID=UPI00184E70B7|nr:dimethylargininase [Leifsonia sp. AK011]NYF09714.1 dimethylargininase [Leifsonia sp. AK011]